MECEFPTQEEMVHDGGNYLDEAGTYHMHIIDVKDGEGPKGEPIDGFLVACSVLAGTTENCQGKLTDLAFFAPKLDQKESSILLTKRCNAAFFLATNVVDPTAFGSRKEVDVTAANGHQFIVSLERKMDWNEQTQKYDIPSRFLRIRFADIWHVDDPDAKAFPKNADALKEIDPKHRHDEAWFGFKAKKNGPPGRGKPQSSSGAAAAKPDYSDL